MVFHTRSLLPLPRTRWVAPGLGSIGRGSAVTSSSASDSKSQAKAISNGIGSLHREHYGRGPDRIRTAINTDLVLTTLEDCFTVVEKKMISKGEFAKVRETRILFQDWMGPAFTEIVESATGRKVRAFFSQVGQDPDIAVELFLLEPLSDKGDGV
jgi:uncharacterized protein YbcI